MIRTAENHRNLKGLYNLPFSKVLVDEKPVVVKEQYLNLLDAVTADSFLWKIMIKIMVSEQIFEN